MDDGSKNSQGVTLIIMPKSQDLRFVLFPGHLPDSLLLSLELISYLKVICAQSWQHIEALWDLRSPKICPKLAPFLKQIEKKHPVYLIILFAYVFDLPEDYSFHQRLQRYPTEVDTNKTLTFDALDFNFIITWLALSWLLPLLVIIRFLNSRVRAKFFASTQVFLT